MNCHVLTLILVTSEVQILNVLMFKMETAWLSSFWPLYSQAVDGTMVFQEVCLLEAWALTEAVVGSPSVD